MATNQRKSEISAIIHCWKAEANAIIHHNGYGSEGPMRDMGLALMEFEAQEEAKIGFNKAKHGLRMPMEGQILKFTNVVKGYQFRWLVLDPESGMLEYFEKEEHKKQRPRGSVHLAAAVVSPSEEDSQTFIVNAANGDIYKLRASDAKERQLWVDRIRSTAEYHTANIAQNSPKLVRDESFNSVSSSKRKESFHKLRGSHESLPVSKRSPREDSFHEVREFQLDAEDHLHQLEENISALSPSGEYMNAFDPELLIFKATSAATLRCVQDCLFILQNADVNKSEASPRSISERQKKMSIADTDNTDYQAKLPDADEEVLDEALYEDKDLESVEEHKSIILHLLSQLKLGMDLTKVVLPTFILERRSLLEMFADCMAHPDFFLKIPDIQDPEGRMVAVLEWYLTSFHNGRKGTIAKKPYNPIIGETFHCSWQVEESADVKHRLTYVAEQVSHHPPISAFYFECPTKKVKVNASIYTKSKFMGMSIGVVMVGKVRLRLEQYDEDYVFSLPSAYARSILTVPWVELGDKVSLTCDKTGYSANIVFHTKPFYGGKLHNITAEAKNSKTGESICKVQGQWNGVMEFTYAEGISKTVDVNDLNVVRKSVRPIQKQEEHESRRLWEHVTNALKNNDIDTATEHKRLLEEVQREGERHRKAMNIEYTAKFFNNVNGTWIHKKLPENFDPDAKK